MSGQVRFVQFEDVPDTGWAHVQDDGMTVVHYGTHTAQADMEAFAEANDCTVGDPGTCWWIPDDFYYDGNDYFHEFDESDPPWVGSALHPGSMPGEKTAPEPGGKP